MGVTPMAEGVTLAKAWVTIIPTTQGAEKAISDSLAGPAESAGSKAGKVSGVAMAAAAGKAMKSTGAKMTVGITTPLVGLAKSALDVGMAFESSMANVAALSGATGADLDKLSETAQAYGASTQFSASQAADAMGYMALAGWDAQQMVDGLGGVLDLAAASGMGLAESSDMVTDYLSAFGLQASDSARFADMLAYAQANSNTSAAQLGEAYRNSAANLHAAGQDVETVTSLLGMMANQGLKGSEAGTALSAVMRDVTNNMVDGAILIGHTSVAVTDAEGNFRDLTQILLDVESATAGMGDAERAAAMGATFTSDSIKGLNLIMSAGVSSAWEFEDQLRGASVTADSFAKAASDMGIDMDAMRGAFEAAGISSEQFEEILGISQGSADMFVETLNEAVAAGFDANDIMADLGVTTEDLQAAMDASEGSASAMATTMNDTLAGRMAEMDSAIEAAAIKLSDALMPAVSVVVEHVTEAASAFADWFGSLDEGTQNAIIAAAGLVAVAGPVVTVLGSIAGIVPKVASAVSGFSKAFGALNTVMRANPILAVVAVIATLVGMFLTAYNTNEEFRAKVDEVFGAISETIGGFFEFFGGIVEGIGGFVSDIGGFFGGLAETAGEKFEGIKTTIGDVWGGIQEGAASAWEGITSTLSGAWDGIQQGASDAFGAVSETVSMDMQTANAVGAAAGGALDAALRGDWEGARTAAEAGFGAIRSNIETKMEAAKQGAISAGNAIGEKLGFPGLGDTVAGVLEGAKGNIDSALEGAKSIVSGAIDNIVGFFSGAKLELPHINLPHFSISGSFSLDPPSIPHISVDWYKTGAIFAGPSVIGVGEAGPEMVLPASGGIMDDFARSVASQVDGGGNGGRVVNVYIDGDRIATDRRLEDAFLGFMDELALVGAV
jgi:TP901 family phage tail tape measure protein